ncbi:MAG TPA: hypothetical protein VG326_20195 [Tepidisphaeraceae bacterium]|jgi:hypothetical protein|nr:hypothetical protein [Tepidisphaeraceae bacterium]
MSIEFNCQGCGKHYKVADAMAGKRAKCKGCGQVVEVPTPVQEPLDVSGIDVDVVDVPPPTPAKPISQRSVGAKTAGAPQDAPARCPSCQAALAPNAVLCTACGFDLRRGVKIAGIDDNVIADDEGSAAVSEQDSQEEPTLDKQKEGNWWRRLWSKPG